MTQTRSASAIITEEVTSWPGVTAGSGSRGEWAFTLGRRELGHLHGDHALHIAFPRALWEELHAQGRIDHHPVFPGKPGYGARRIEGEDDVRDAIALLRLNYDRAGGPPVLPGLRASAPQTLPFAPSEEIRAFLLEREQGNVIVYSVAGLDVREPWVADAGGAGRQYLNHGHEAIFGPAPGGPPLFVHGADREAVEDEEGVRVRATFSRRHRLGDDFEAIPIPGHTPGATAYVWDSGSHRYLFTGDSLYLRGDEWRVAVLGSSDRAAYLRSLELLRELEFDVLVPWVAQRGGPFYAHTDPADARARIAAIIQRVRRGEDR